MKYFDEETQTYKDISIKTLDTLPVGAVIDYDGEDVPVGWEETKDYSTEEVVVGTWVNNKPIYRKVISGSTAAANTQGKYTIASNVSQVINVSGYIYIDSSTSLPLNYSNTGAPIFYLINNNDLAIQVGNSSFANKSFVAIVEYTKTTD